MHPDAETQRPAAGQVWQPAGLLPPRSYEPTPLLCTSIVPDTATAVWEGEWPAADKVELVFPFPDGRGAAFQGAVASRELGHAHFGGLGDGQNGVGVEVFLGQDVAVIAGLTLAMARLEALGTKGATAAYVPSAILGALHYLAGGECLLVVVFGFACSC